MRNWIIFTGLVSLGIFSFANINPLSERIQEKESFEGTIEFNKKIGASESRYIYYVKGDRVRVEELNTDGTIQGIMLVNTTDKTVRALSPERKLYMDVPSTSTFSTSSVSVEKKESKKSLMEYSCAEWVASSKDEDRNISYWMAFDNFDFFIPFLKTINRKDKQAVYFLAMTGTNGAFPMLSIETKSDGTEISRLAVTAINKKSMEESLFVIPDDYKKM